MVNNFHKYAEVLRTIGNYRQNYVIFCEKTEFVNNYGFKNLPVAVTSYESTKPEWIHSIEASIVIYQIAPELLIEHPEYLCLANELQYSVQNFQFLSSRGVLSTFKPIANSVGPANTQVVILNQKVLSYSTFIVFKKPRYQLKDAIVMHYRDSLQLEDYHLLIYDVVRNLALVVIWDTREIVAFKKIEDDAEKTAIFDSVHVDDSSKYLYIWKELWERIETKYPDDAEELHSYMKEHFVSDVVETY